MKDSSVLNLPSYSSHPQENQNGQQNEISETNSSQRTNNRSEMGFSQQEGSKNTEGTKRKSTKNKVKMGQKLRPLDQSGTSNIRGVLGVASLHIDAESIKQKEQQNLQTYVTNNRNQISILVQIAPPEIQPLYSSRVKRNKRNRRRLSNQNVEGENFHNMTTKPMIQFNTPTVKPILDQCYDECDGYISNYEDSRPQLQNYCGNSNFDYKYGNRWDCDSDLY